MRGNYEQTRRCANQSLVVSQQRSNEQQHAARRNFSSSTLLSFLPALACLADAWQQRADEQLACCSRCCVIRSGCSQQAAAWPIENATEAYRHFRVQPKGMTSEGGFGHLVCAGIEVWGRVRRINDLA